jgi:hypothetical protein
MSRQPDDRSWEEEHIHHLNVEIETLKRAICIYAREQMVMSDFSDDKDVVKYFIDNANHLDK